MCTVYGFGSGYGRRRTIKKEIYAMRPEWGSEWLVADSSVSEAKSVLQHCHAIKPTSIIYMCGSAATPCWFLSAHLICVVSVRVEYVMHGRTGDRVDVSRWAYRWATECMCVCVIGTRLFHIYISLHFIDIWKFISDNRSYGVRCGWREGPSRESTDDARNPLQGYQVACT